MSLSLDAAKPIRPGEELPLERLEPWLRQKLPAASGPLSVEQFSHGYSNLTYLVRLGSAEYVLRRPPFGNQVKTAHDMGREFRVLSALWPVYAPAPRPFVYSDEEDVLGVPFYVMERRRGVILRKDVSAERIDPATVHRLGLAFVDNLAGLHALDYKAAGLGDFGKPDGYVARQVTGWTRRYAEARTDDVPTFERVTRWLADQLPADSGAALIHNDYKYDNLLLDPADLTRIVAVLDWEMATVGDPLMDLGTTLGYWFEANDPPGLRQLAAGPTYLAGSPTRQELVARYEEKTGRAIANGLFYYLYGLFKIAGIVQQIYARFVRGHTRDPRFARLHEFVSVLGQHAERVLDAGRV